MAPDENIIVFIELLSYAMLIGRGFLKLKLSPKS